MKKVRKVYIENSDLYYDKMFKGRGWEVVRSPLEADLIQFTGGEDVDPSLYGEEKHSTTRSNPRRDSHESHLFRQVVGKIPLAGICRGGQFLNVMSGGRMWQHVDSHEEDDHRTNFTGRHEEDDVKVTSSHHQMMRPSSEGEIIGVANRSNFKETATEGAPSQPYEDVEAVYYPNTNSLCFQPHPEWVGEDHPCQEVYFKLIEAYLFKEKE